MVMLVVQGISFSYGSSDVLADVSFEASDGEIVGVIGPNGSGKTTLLKCVNRALSPRVGTVLIDGRDYAELTRREIAGNIGVVPQNSVVSFPFTVLDIVMMGRTPSMERFERESEKDLEIVKKALEMTNVVGLVDRTMDQISGGEKQRVVIARALAQKPKILLLDEPTLHLDVNHQLEILDLIRNLARSERLTVIIVSHDLNLAARYCDKLILMSSGKIEASGRVMEVLTEKNIESVFRVKAAVTYDKHLGAYTVTPLECCR
ncbi:MAG: ABC transporter ATP-binding protein [Methanomassiliicoccales archaeon]|nr:ABC transporter ATP-binding protein [Methanomassiliicoccales archaeon]